MTQATGVSAISRLVDRLAHLPVKPQLFIEVDNPVNRQKSGNNLDLGFTKYRLHLRTGEIIEREIAEASTFRQNISREKIKLDNENQLEKEVRELKVVIARLLAKEIRQSYNKSKTQLENILDVINKNAPELNSDDDLITLTVFYSLKTKLKNNSEHTDLLTRFPKGFLNPNNEFFESRVRILMKHLLIDIEGYENALQIERLRDFQSVMKAAGLDSVDHLLSRIDLLSVTFPGYLDGENPYIRPWLAYQPGKWHGESGKELARRATFWLLKYGEKVIDDNGKYDLNKLKKVIESLAFDKNEYGTMGMLRNCPYTPNVVEAVRLALPEAVGGKPNQLHRWDIKYEGKWEDKYLIDELTEYIAEHKLKCVDQHGKVSVGKILGDINWHDEYRAECNDALTANKSGMITAYNALSHKYPHLFGWRKEQIKPWQIVQGSMWQGAIGRRLFQEAMAYTFWSNGLGSMNTEAYRPKFTFIKKEFIDWYDKNLRENPSFIEDLLNENGLSAPYSKIAGKCQGGALRLLFTEKKPDIEVGKQRVRSSVLDLLKGNNDICTIEFRPVKKTTDRSKLISDLFLEEVDFVSAPQFRFKRQNRLDEISSKRHNVEGTKIKDVLDDKSQFEFLCGVKDLLLATDTDSTALFHNIEKISAGLSDEDLIRLFEVLRISFVDDLSIKPGAKIKLKKILEDLQYIEGGQKEFMLEAINNARMLASHGLPIENTYFLALENTIGFLNEVIRDYEAQGYIKSKKLAKHPPVSCDGY